MPIFKKPSNKSKAQQYLESVDNVPQVSALMSKEVSDYRRDKLAQEVNQGMFKDGSAAIEHDDSGLGNVISSVGIVKNAQMLSSANGGMISGGNTIKQAPEIYSPLWLNSNISLPRDRATINAWCRSFYALNPFVHNSINLHSTYPISKLNIKCPNKQIEKFFNDMIEETDLMNICVQIAQEYWLLGEAFPYAELDMSKGKWSRFLIQNPDYMIVKKTVMADEPIIMMRPDQDLKTMILSNKPRDVEQRKQLNPEIVQAVKRGENIQMDNFNISHLARRISPYETRGTGLPVCIFRQLMLFDQLRESKYAQASMMVNPLTLIKVGDGADWRPTAEQLEGYREVFACHDEETEVLTDRGFKKFHEVINFKEENGIISEVNSNQEFKIACINSKSKNIEYHKPINTFLSQYNGEMVQFKARNYDILVTPNHKMFIQKQLSGSGKTIWSDHYKEEAKNIDISKENYRFMGTTSWEGKKIESVQVLDKEVPAYLYLSLLGYIISEGYVGQNMTHLTQKIDSDCIDDMKYSIKSFAKLFNKKCSESIISTKDYKAQGFKKQPCDRWISYICSKDLMNYFKKEISSDGIHSTSHYKMIPPWIKELHADHLKVILNSLVNGDGSHVQGRQYMSYKYYTASKQLADDIQEIAFKCGYNPFQGKHKPRGKSAEYIISWTDSNDGKNPRVAKGDQSTPNVQQIKYNGKVWCFEVPTGLFVTRRNGKITIQGNSAQNDKDFKIFTHSGVTVEKIGSGQGIYDISGDITQLVKEIYIGLQVPSVLLDGADITYNNGGVALDALRQRYMSFRNKMSTWLKRKVFAPISKIQGFYELKDGQKQLIVPEVDWNHMSLFDASDYIGVLKELTTSTGDEPRRVSLHSLYRSLGLEFEDETIKLRKEAIQTAIAVKERASLDSMDLISLRALDRDNEIPEVEKSNEEQKEQALPGEESGGLGGGLPGMSEPPGLPPTK